MGGVLGYFALQGFEDWEPTLLGIVAASMIYVAVADLIPGLHKRPELRATAQQALLIAAGRGGHRPGSRPQRGRALAEKGPFAGPCGVFDRPVCAAQNTPP